MNCGSRHLAKTKTELASRDCHVCSLGTCNHSASLSLPFWSQEQIKRVLESFSASQETDVSEAHHSLKNVCDRKDRFVKLFVWNVRQLCSRT